MLCINFGRSLIINQTLSIFSLVWTLNPIYLVNPLYRIKSINRIEYALSFRFQNYKWTNLLVTEKGGVFNSSSQKLSVKAMIEI